MTEDQYEDYVNNLHQKYPKMFEGKYGGIAVGAGWWPMIETLCGVIQNHIDQSKGECPQVVLEQVKEKFGSLRFYYQGGDDFIHGAVWLAESMSGKLCEECGAPGKRVGNGWVRTLCDFHIAELEAIRAEEMKKNGFEE